jgi:hypothetical protein
MKNIEAKVKASALLTLLVGVALTLLNEVQADNKLLGSLPPWAQSLITLFGPPLAAFLAGYAAPHTARPPAARPPR